MSKIIKNILKWFAIFLLVLLVIGITYEYYSRWQLSRSDLNDRTFVEVNGTKLHYVKKGSGKYTVVFVSGMGSNHTIWQELQDTLQTDAVTLSYDRNGLLFSEKSDISITNESVSDELHQLLEKTNCPKPYILVAHSMGGIYIRPFIKAHHADIAGIVLAEAAHPHQLKKASQELLDTRFIPSKGFLNFVVNSGIYRALFSFIPVSPEIPVDHPLHTLEKDFFYRSYETLLDEVANDSLNFKHAEQYSSFGNTPLTVILGTNEVRYATIKDQKIKNEYKCLTDSLAHDLLHLSTDSKLVRAANSGHIFQTHDAVLVISEIRKLINKAEK